MTKIIPIEKEYTLDQSNNLIKYFAPCDLNSQLVDYDKICGSISQAESTVLISSTAGLDHSLLEAVYSAMENGARVYVILKSFKNTVDLLAKFDKNKTAVLREVPVIENNFVIVDGKAVIYTDSLSAKSNIAIELTVNQSEDLDYWFKYYFWNQAEGEKLLSQVSQPKESPYPPFFTEKAHVDLIDDSLSGVNAKMWPCHKSQFGDVEIGDEEVYLSKDINIPLLFTENKSQIGRFVFDSNMIEYFGQTYKLQEEPLEEIHETILVYEEDWKKERVVLADEIVNLDSIESNTIESMMDTYPKDYPTSPYTIELNYQWEVTPPQLPQSATQAKLYSQFETAQLKMKSDLVVLKREINSILEKKSSVLNLFSGVTRKAKENLKVLADWEAFSFVECTSNQLKDVARKDGTFEAFYKSIVKDSSEFKVGVDKEEKKKVWQEQSDKKKVVFSENEKQLIDMRTVSTKLKNELDILSKEYNSVKSSINSLDKNDKSRVEKLKSQKMAKEDSVKSHNKKLNQKEAEQNSLASEIKKNYTNFVYINAVNELSNLKKSKGSNTQFVSFDVPKYVLPEVGVLFEDKNSYYLQIEDYDELERANEIAANRYVDKPCKVVAKGP